MHENTLLHGFYIRSLLMQAFDADVTMTSYNEGYRQGICHKIQGSLWIAKLVDVILKSFNAAMCCSHDTYVKIDQKVS